MELKNILKLGNYCIALVMFGLTLYLIITGKSADTNTLTIGITGLFGIVCLNYAGRD